MPQQGPLFLTGAGVPDLDLSPADLAARSCQRAAVGTEGDTGDGAGVAPQCAEFAAAARVPDFDLRRVQAGPAGSRQPVPIGAEGHTDDLIRTRDDRQQFLPGT